METIVQMESGAALHTFRTEMETCATLDIVRYKQVQFGKIWWNQVQSGIIRYTFLESGYNQVPLCGATIKYNSLKIALHVHFI